MRAQTFAVVVLSGCVGLPSIAPEPQRSVVPISLDGGGIEPVGTGLRIDFGRHGPGVIETVSRLQGEPPTATIRDCGSVGVTAARWDDGLTLVFRHNAFAGWRTTDAARSATGALAAGAACAG